MCHHTGRESRDVVCCPESVSSDDMSLKLRWLWQVVEQVSKGPEGMGGQDPRHILGWRFSDLVGHLKD
jgi:hypothetical protein